MRDAPHICIIGAGLAGSLLAVLLAKQGFRVSVYERRPDPRTKGTIGGRSINLALSARGIDALRAAELDDRVLKDAIPMPGRMMHAQHADASGHVPLTYQPYSHDPADAINSISRAGLNLTLINAADEHPNVDMHFSSGASPDDIDLATPSITITNTANHHSTTIEPDLLIGADGAFSAVRQRMQKTDRFEYSQSYLQHGYKELTIPPAKACGVDPHTHDGFAMEPAALHIWPRGSSMMIALPNNDRTFTCTLFWPYQGPHSFASLEAPGVRTDAQTVLGFFSEHYPDAVPLMPTLAHDFADNPTSSLVTIRCYPWVAPFYEGGHARVALLGDASHAIVPFFGQGMNAAFEDAKSLAQCLADAGGTSANAAQRSDALHRYQNQRKDNADAIAQMALDNFVEMRDLTAQPDFLYKKRIEQLLHRERPDIVQPLYNLVSFSTIPYAQALRRGRQTDAMLSRITEKLPLADAEQLSSDDWRGRVLALADEHNAL